MATACDTRTKLIDSVCVSPIVSRAKELIFRIAMSAYRLVVLTIGPIGTSLRRALTYNSIVNSAMYIKNEPPANKANGATLKAPRSKIGAGLLRSFRGLSKAMPTADRKTAMKPHTLTTHGNPMRGVRYWTMAGKRIAPTEDPHAGMDIASVRFLRK